MLLTRSPYDAHGDAFRNASQRIEDILPAMYKEFAEDGYIIAIDVPSRSLTVEEVDIAAPRDSDAWYLALLQRQFPGSWLPLDEAQIVRAAAPHFALVSSSDGRLDYIQTIAEWSKRTGARSLRKTLLKLQLVPRWLRSADFRLAFTSGVGANRVCFERELLGHRRLVFERRD